MNHYLTKLTKNMNWYTAVTCGGSVYFIYRLLTRFFVPFTLSPHSFSSSPSLLSCHSDKVIWGVCVLVCMHALTRCVKSCLDEWDLSHKSVWMLNLSGFKIVRALQHIPMDPWLSDTKDNETMKWKDWWIQREEVKGRRKKSTTQGERCISIVIFIDIAWCFSLCVSNKN